MGVFGAAANLYLNSRGSGKVLALPAGQRFPGEINKEGLSVARKDRNSEGNMASEIGSVFSLVIPICPE